MAKTLMRHICAILVLPDCSAGPNEIIVQGTASLIDTGTSKLVITCAHVWSGYQEIRANCASAVVALSGEPGTAPLVINSAVCVSLDADMDLAVLRLDPEDCVDKLGKAYFACRQWPPRAASKGDVTAVIGFPGIYRWPASGELRLSAVEFVDFVSSVSDRNIVFVDEDAERRLVYLNPRLAQPTDLGGMSGAVVYVGTPGEPVQPAGVLYEVQIAEGEDATRAWVYASRIDYLEPDGTVSQARVPWR